MKFKSTLLAAVTAGSLITVGSLFAGDVTPSALDVRIAQVRTTLTSTRLIEAPDKAARLVWQAPAKLRGEVAKAAIEAALTKHPTAVYATVKAVMTVAPEHVSSIMEGVIAVAPSNVRTALKAVSEVNEDGLLAAVQVVNDKAPAQAQVAQSFAARRQGNAKLAAGLFSSNGATSSSSTTVVTLPPPRVANNYQF